MKCGKCGHDNRTGAKFCEECGAHLSAVCMNCGAQLSSTARFCSECSHPIGQAAASGPDSAPQFAAPEAYTPRHLAEKILSSKAALEGERKQVTALFADLKSSMELFADRDPEEARRFLDPVIEQIATLRSLLLGRRERDNRAELSNTDAEPLPDGPEREAIPQFRMYADAKNFK